MKIGILTYDKVHNYGAVLQAYAVKAVLNSMGAQCGFLSYDRDYRFVPRDQVNKYKIGLGSVPFYMGYLWKNGLGSIVFHCRKKKILDRFRRKYLPSAGDYKRCTADTVVVGSDEVFSLEIGINPFFYGNGLPVKKIVGYAGCFGPTTMHDIKRLGQEEMIRRGFLRMAALSVRDENSRKIAVELTERAVPVVCDPVILYGYQKEMDACLPSLKNYIVVYSYDKHMNHPDEIREIKKYARAENLAVVSLGYYHAWCDNRLISPMELPGWIKNARLVITDTFHGVVLSVLCNTPMAVKIRDNKNKLGFLLAEYGLQDRVMDNFCELEKTAKKTIDFAAVNRELEKKREKSMRFLKNALSCGELENDSTDQEE